MRIPLLQTLSGRIILGFTVLTLTFGTISAFIVYYMEILSREIRLIRTGYVPLALAAKDLEEKQNILRSYISDELEAENDPDRAQWRIIKYQRARQWALRQTEKVLEDLPPVPPHHRSQINGTKQLFAEIGREIDSHAQRYRLIQTTPPLAVLEETLQNHSINRDHYIKAKEAAAELRVSEAALWTKIGFLASEQNEQAQKTAITLESNERRLRVFTIIMGLLAVSVGLLVTIWATMTLRPLHRLRDAARRIAEGEYKSRILEKGPAEVADLAREFNIMGQAIEERERELVRQERLVAVGAMAAMITHEIRNPLSAIGLNTELLEEELGELDGADEMSALCQAITAEVDRLTAITEEYLQFARLPRPKLQVEDVNAIARSLANFQREPLAMRGVDLVCQLDDDLPPVRVDHDQLRQALLNLLRNAAEAVAEHGGGTVTLGSRRIRDEEADLVELSVGDTGPGIPEEIISRLFDPFVSSKEGGTGLGLALTHQIIREHGGEIRVESASDRGAVFVIALPASRNPD
ncbi:MAG: ATP-binding protein [Proteobacteria bacterium]|nr:ATP-binding protein [Pseudomonadota bacterium]